MRGMLLYQKQDANYNQGFINYMIEKAKEYGIVLELFYIEDIQYGVKAGAGYILYKGQSVEGISLAINRCRDAMISKQLESMGIFVFNSSAVTEICNDKAKTYQQLQNQGIAMIDSIYVKNKQLKQQLEQEQEQVVVKSVSGHGGNQVFLYDGTNGEEICRKMAGEDVVIQSYIKGTGQDVRVYVVGEEIIAAVLRSATDGFKANYSLGGQVSLYELKEAQESLVKQIMGTLSFDYVGIDFLIGNDGEFIFNEIEDAVGARMLYQCSDVDIVVHYMEHIAKKMNVLC